MTERKIPQSRKDCFFGLHFDFHATDEIPVTGTDREKFAAYLDAVKPDFVQFDTKGHPGYASYFSEFGTVVPGLKYDQLKMVREETKKRGIRLYAHYSGVRDVRVSTDHPEWTPLSPEGILDTDATDLASPYVDEVMIPQLCELAGKYGLDGVWVDGEEWAVKLNYKDEYVVPFKEKTGFTEIVQDGEHPSHFAFRQIFHKQFIEYVKKYTKAVHEKYPDFEITSNYACSNEMPEMTLIDDLDYLSGDFADQSTARLSVRCFAGVEKVWDLMSWGSRGYFLTPKGGFMSRANKNLKRLCRECAMVIAAGGGYHIVHCMTRQGEVRDTEKELTVKLAAFARERQEFCHHGMPLVSAAVWYSEYDRNHRRGTVFMPLQIKGAICDLVLDGGRPVDVIYDDVIVSDKVHEYPAIIVPDDKYISDEHRAALINYMENGGKLIVCGQPACKAFVEIEKEYEDCKIFYYPHGMYMTGVGENIVTFGEDITPFVSCYEDYMKKDMPTVNAIAYKKWGKGEIYCLGWNVAEDYDKTKDHVLREVFRDIMDKADPEPWVYHEAGIRRVEVMPTVKDGEMMAHIINITERIMSGNYDDFPAIHDITIAIKCSEKPKCIMEEPFHRELEFTYDGKYAHVKVPELDIHSILIPKY